MAYVYVEQLLIDNGLINAFLLYVCMRLVRRPPRAWRLALGSLAGTLGGVALLMVSTPLPLQWAAKIVLSAAMRVICVGARDGRLFLRMFGALWAVTLAMGGASLAMVFLLGGSFAAGQGYIALAGVNPGVYIAGGWLTYLLVRHVWLRARARGQRAQRQVTLRVRVDAREMACTALVDSGHSLRTPGSNRAVLVLSLIHI